MVSVETMLVILASLRFRLGEYFFVGAEGLHEGEVIRILNLAEAVVEFQDKLQAAMTADVDDESPERQEANAEVDLAFRPVFDVVSGWADNTFPAFAAKREAAIAIRDAIFPDGAAVLKPPYKTKWAVLDARLKQMEERPLIAALRQLGMAEMASPMTGSVERMGKVLGITEAKGKTEQSAGEALDACKEVLREVQRAVVGTIRRNDKVSLERAAEALFPLYEAKQEIAEARRSSRADDRKVEEPVAPVAVVNPPAPPAPPVEPGT